MPSSVTEYNHRVIDLCHIRAHCCPMDSPGSDVDNRYMSSVLQLSKPLTECLQCPTVKGLNVRTFRESDIAGWLALRERAFARERVGVRKWSVDDFLEEFLHKWWWRPEWMWLAESEGRSEQRELVGSV